MTDDENHIGAAVPVTGESRAYLNPRQLVSYREHRRQLAQWMQNLGKDPEKANGYAESTVKTRTARLDKFYRWVWKQEDGYTEAVSTSNAGAWMEFHGGGAGADLHERFANW
ncbi:hypothetical protein GCM10008995_23650 [Halobellus salinus]|uniref:Uncharacterized protein n=1 Tax=Halobellus salinus TaxID=931585 RepID=A0A830EQ72_9EURY|nr:hypothetical protein [Halobellus salinus]GGJ13102.1 hypothetical protein GCM10008995_23650 [Halobellus salinus]SMP15964.1 hypothetical protein SAMN06265347_105202 [Halobellus salinus]